MSYIPNTPEDQQAMLETLGLPSLEALLAPVPENVRLRRPLNLPPALPEPDLKRLLSRLAAENKNLDTVISFLGAGTYDHAIPSVVSHLQRRSEFVTSYTPYQPEVSQGMLQAINEAVTPTTAAVVIQQPNFFGCIEDVRAIEPIAHKGKAVFVATITEPASLGILTPPGEYGADIAVGELMSFGNPMSYGGPALGFMASRSKYMRMLPGRLVGQTVEEGAGKQTGYVLTLQTREQHIRRERATSNICTNQSLLA